MKSLQACGLFHLSMILLGFCSCASRSIVKIHSQKFNQAQLSTMCGRGGTGNLFCWRGVVVAQCAKGLVVKYDDFPRHPLLLPPPKKSGIVSLSVTFRARSPPNLLRQQRLRFRRAVARAVAAASPTPSSQLDGNAGPHEGLLLQTQSLPERRSISSGLRMATANVLTLTDRGRLLSVCGWMERNKIDIFLRSNCPTHRRQRSLLQRAGRWITKAKSSVHHPW